MKNYKENSKKVENCINDIHHDVSKLGFRGSGTAFVEKMIDITIKEKSSLYGLKSDIVKAVYFGHTETGRKRFQKQTLDQIIFEIQQK